MSNDLLTLIEQYWNLAYAEGKEGRTHDTETGDAQRVLHQIKDAIAALESAIAAQGEKTKMVTPYITQEQFDKAFPADHTAKVELPVVADKCQHKKINHGYENGYDLAWCDDCGLITSCGDGLLSIAESKRNDRTEWCKTHLVSWGCQSEANPIDKWGNGTRCKNWCGHTYCPTAFRDAQAAIAAQGEKK